MADEKKVTDDRKQIEERVAKAYEIETPTPTQAENDAAKLAALNQEPEAPGGDAKTTKTSTAQPAGSSYSTRSASAKSE